MDDVYCESIALKKCVVSHLHNVHRVVDTLSLFTNGIGGVLKTNLEICAVNK